MNIVNTIIIIAGKYLFLIPIIFWIFYFFKTKNKKVFVLHTIISCVIAIILLYIASSLYYDPRPFTVDNSVPLIPHSPDNGFPSDHALLTATLSSILFLFSVRLGILSWIFTLLVGGARVLAGIHHVIDIIASIFIAIISATVSYLILKKSNMFST